MSLEVAEAPLQQFLFVPELSKERVLHASLVVHSVHGAAAPAPAFDELAAALVAVTWRRMGGCLAANHTNRLPSHTVSSHYTKVAQQSLCHLVSAVWSARSRAPRGRWRRWPTRSRGPPISSSELLLSTVLNLSVLKSISPDWFTWPKRWRAPPTLASELLLSTIFGMAFQLDRLAWPTRSRDLSSEPDLCQT